MPVPYPVDEEDFSNATKALLNAIAEGGGGSENYSTDERVVGTWINGKPIYRRCWQGNIESPANTWKVNILPDSGGIDEIVGFGGWYQIGGTNPNKVTVGAANMDATTVSTLVSAVSTDSLDFNSVSGNERSGTTNNAFSIWAEYTKTTD